MSFVCTLCNRRRALAESLRSLKDQWTPEHEFIVVDFASDNWEWEPAIPIRRLDYPRPFRNAFGNNRGAEAAKGDIILFTHADMLYPPGFLAQVKRRILEEGWDAYYPIWKDIQSDGTVPREYRRTAFGVCAFNAFAWNGMEWPEWGDDHWGGEDTLLHKDAVKQLKVYTEEVYGLLHQPHPTEREWLERFMG